ncbi:DNA adenine methylase [Aminobacter aminovorans]|uniref:DNA adenine methylase n=1 Tax=Aminobacter aminovorans TaxID=83263 RepID=UPI00285E5EEC|nr:DNA adenine methylase [Aminobacter aminovorans]MDR7220337.1 DNA adenine methylase [Aminobacter aminovorans]
MTAPTRPILRWHGGKWRLAPWIINHFPPHKIYVEPFGGAASVLLQKPRATSEIWNDRDGELVNLFGVLREQPADLARLVALTPFSRDEYDSLYEPSADPLERARRFVARSFMGVNSKGALRKSGFDTRINPDGFISRVRSLVAVPEEIAAVAGRFLGVVIENDDALALIARYNRADCLAYVDPPYLDSVGGVYRHGVDHEALLSALVDVDSMVVLSDYPSDLYDDTLSGWTRLETKAFADGAHERCEVIWLNPACVDGLGAARHRRAGGQGTPLFEVAR